MADRFVCDCKQQPQIDVSLLGVLFALRMCSSIFLSPSSRLPDFSRRPLLITAMLLLGRRIGHLGDDVAQEIKLFVGDDGLLQMRGSHFLRVLVARFEGGLEDEGDDEEFQRFRCPRRQMQSAQCLCIAITEKAQMKV